MTKEKTKKETKRFNYLLGTAASAWILALLVIIAEFIEPFKNVLKSLFTHHWIGKAVLMLITFLLIGFLMRKKETLWNVTAEKSAWWSTLSSLIIIFLFFFFIFMMEQ